MNQLMLRSKMTPNFTHIFLLKIKKASEFAKTNVDIKPLQQIEKID